MINAKELINTLKVQHKALQTDLTLALENTTLPDANKDTFEMLKKFSTDLKTHLETENNIFYPNYLDKKIKNGEDITNTKEFIKEMECIGNKVKAFLDKYNDPSIINDNTKNFQTELINIKDVLNTRIETEEDGIFDLYLAMAY